MKKKKRKRLMKINSCVKLFITITTTGKKKLKKCGIHILLIYANIYQYVHISIII